MAEDKTKKPALDLRSLATGGTQEEQLKDDQLDEVSGGNGWGWCDEVPWRGNNNI